MDHYPRTLYVGAMPIGRADATGITTASLYEKWPSTQLLQVTYRDDPDAVPRGSLHVLPRHTSPAEAAVSMLRPGGRGSRVIAEDGRNAATRGGEQGTIPWSQRAANALRVASDVTPIRVPRASLACLAAYDPRVIHTLLGGVRILRTALALSRRLQLPIVPHFMDDWVDTLYSGGELGGLARHEVSRLLERVLDRAPLCLVIGDQMREVYAERLGKECIVAGNSVALSAFRGLPGPRMGSPRRLRYVGSLGLGRVDVLAEVARTLDMYNSRNTTQWHLEIYAPEAERPRAEQLAIDTTCVRYCGSASVDQVPACLAASDALIFVESSSERVARYTMHSVSTKVPQYLAAARPILVFAPRGQASARILLDSGRAVDAGGGGEDRIESALGWISATAGQAFAISTTDPVHEFDSDSVRERFRAALSRAALTAGSHL